MDHPSLQTTPRVELDISKHVPGKSVGYIAVTNGAYRDGHEISRTEKEKMTMANRPSVIIH